MVDFIELKFRLRSIPIIVNFLWKQEHEQLTLYTCTFMMCWPYWKSLFT